MRKVTISSFRVSVVIPVYNAAQYVRQAVESALAQPEVCEVILVEDGSPDESLVVCQQLARNHTLVHLYQHPGGVNRGAASSRNLGIVKSNMPYIAFLDADDYFLPGRFSIPEQRFDADPTCEGVYEAVGIHFESNLGKQRWMASTMTGKGITTVNGPMPPENLFRDLIKGWKGSIHLNGLIIRRTILLKSGLMNAKLGSMHEDSDFFLRIAAVGRLLSGNISKPVAIRRVHEDNRISAPRTAAEIRKDKMRLRIETYRWCKKNKLHEHQQLAFKKLLSDYRQLKRPRLITDKPISGPAKKALTFSLLAIEYPIVILNQIYWHELGSAMWGFLKNHILKLEKKQ